MLKKQLTVNVNDKTFHVSQIDELLNDLLSINMDILLDIPKVRESLVEFFKKELEKELF